MHPIIISSLFLLISMSGYAADAPKTVSYAAEKAEVVISEDTLPQAISFVIPTEGGEETHTLSIKEIEAIDLTSFEEITQENAQQGLPTLIAHTTYLNGEKVGYSSYKAQNLIDTFEYQDDLRDPLTNCDVLRASVHLVDVPTCNTPSSLQTIFLGNLPEHQSKVQNLYQQIDKLNQTNEDKEIKTIKFFIKAGKIYSFNESLKDTHSAYNAKLALKFYQRAINTIENMPQNISCNYKNNSLKLQHRNCLRRCGNIYADFYVNDKKDDYAKGALYYYTHAAQLGDGKADKKAYHFIDKSVDGTFLRNSQYGKIYLEKAKQLVSEIPQQEYDYHFLSRIYLKLGNLHEARAWLRRAYSLNYVPTILRKNRSKPQQDEPDSKRGKLN